MWRARGAASRNSVAPGASKAVWRVGAHPRPASISGSCARTAAPHDRHAHRPGATARGGQSAGSRSAKRTLKRAPPSGESPTSIRAPWWRTCCSTRARPRPEPSPLVDSEAREGRRRSARGRRRRCRARRRRRSAAAPPSSPWARRRRASRGSWPSERPWRTAFSTRLSASSRSPGSQPSIATGVSGSSALRSRPGWRSTRGGRGRVDDLGEVDLGELERPGVAAGQRLQAVEELDEAALLGQRVAEHLRAALGREVEVALERRQRRLHAGQRRAQLVPGVGGEAPRRGQGARAVGGRAPEAREHRVEARAPASAARSGRAGGTRRSRSSSSATLEATVRSRRSGRRTRSAASQTPAPATSSATQAEREQPAVAARPGGARARPATSTISRRASPPRPLSCSVVT